MQCDYHDQGLCSSCTLIDQPYAAQLAHKASVVRDTLGISGGMQWLPPVASAEQGFRNKAKMVVAGTVDNPTVGILDPRGRGIDLRACPLYPTAVAQALEVVAHFSRDMRLLPYNVPKARGELKHIVLTISPDGEFMVRFVLRSLRQVDRIREHLPQLEEQLPDARVVSVNLQPEHKAVVEGPQEIVLTRQDTLRMRVNHVGLYLRPRSFFQTNTDVATALYHRAAQWADAIAPQRVVDLYCGVGGFALHLAAPGRTVMGVEVSEDAVAAARRAATELGPVGECVHFRAGDATVQGGGPRHVFPGDAPDGEHLFDYDAADLVVVNPPRRGLGVDLARRLDASAVSSMIYSSCNATSLARDLAQMPSWKPVEGQVLDMFPHTRHYEVALLLRRR